MTIVSYEQKIMLSNQEPIMYLRGARQQTGGRAQPFFAYLILPVAQLSRLNRDMEEGQLVQLAEYGRVVLQGHGAPSDEQKLYMERYYGFDHTDHFAEDPAEDSTARAA